MTPDEENINNFNNLDETDETDKSHKDFNIVKYINELDIEDENNYIFIDESSESRTREKLKIIVCLDEDESIQENKLKIFQFATFFFNRESNFPTSDQFINDCGLDIHLKITGYINNMVMFNANIFQLISLSGKYNAIKLWIETRLFNINEYFYYGNEQTLSHIFCNSEILKLFIYYGCDLDLRDSYGFTVRELIYI